MSVPAAQAFIAVSQKNKLLLDISQELYGGQIHVQRSSQEFKWVAHRRNDVDVLLRDYFRNYPARTTKGKRLKLIVRYYELCKSKAQLAPDTTLLGKI